MDKTDVYKTDVSRGKDETRDPWGEDDEYPRADWKTEVANGDTNQGYWSWVDHQREADVNAMLDGVSGEELDDLVHDLCSNMASEVNNGGPSVQAAFLMEQLGVEDAAAAIRSALQPPVTVTVVLEKS